MATTLKSLSEHSPKNILDIGGKTFGVIVSEWNEEVTEALFSGAYQTLIQHGAKKKISFERMFQGHLNCH